MIDLSPSLRSLLLCMILFVPDSCCAANLDTVEPILILGDSLSAGYGINVEASWPALLGERLREQGYPYRVVNASVSGETTAGGARRISLLVQEHQPAVVVIALGANDGLRGLPVAEVKRNLSRIIDAVQTAGAVAVLLKVRIPPNYGPQYSESFEGLFDDLADHSGLIYAPFMLERFALKQTAFQSDGLHPTAAVQPHILDTLWPAIDAAVTAAGAQDLLQ